MFKEKLKNFTEIVDSSKSLLVLVVLLLTFPFTIEQYWRLNIFPLSEVYFYKHTISVALGIFAIFGLIYCTLCAIGDYKHRAKENKLDDVSIALAMVLAVPTILYLSIIYSGIQFRPMTSFMDYIFVFLFLLLSLGLLYSSYIEHQYQVKGIFLEKIPALLQFIFGFLILYLFILLSFPNLLSVVNKSLLQDIQQKRRAIIDLKYCEGYPTIMNKKINDQYCLATLDVYFETSSTVYTRVNENNEDIILPIAKDDILGKQLPTILEKNSSKFLVTSH